MLIESKGLAETIARMQARTERVQHLEPALEVFGQSIVKQTDDKFHRSMDWDGQPFADLMPSTIEQRARTHAGGVRVRSDGVTRGGYRAKRKELRTKLAGQGKSRKQITKALRTNRRAYERKKLKITAPGGIKILVDTARARNSNHVDPPEPTSITWSAVGYLGYHMTGTVRMEARNPTAFVYAESKWQLHPDAAKQFDQMMLAFIVRGEHGLTGAA